MKAVVLVGGYGTRLRPLTLHRPKPLLPVVNRAMIEHSVQALASCGVDEVVLAIGFKPDDFTAAFPDRRLGAVALRYAVEAEPLDTAGAIRFAAAVAGVDTRFIVQNGDVLTDLDLALLLETHEAAGAEGTIALTEVDDPSRFGVVPIDRSGRVEAFIEKPLIEAAPSHWINAGTYVLEPEFLARIPPDRPVSIEREVFPEVVADRALFAIQSGAYWVDAGTPETYLRANIDLVDGTRARQDGVHPSATVEDGAQVIDSVIGAGATIGSGAVVRRSVIHESAVVESDTELADAVVGRGARIGVGAVVREFSVLGDDVNVPAGAVVAGARLPDD